MLLFKKGYHYYFWIMTIANYKGDKWNNLFSISGWIYLEKFGEVMSGNVFKFAISSDRFTFLSQSLKYHDCFILDLVNMITFSRWCVFWWLTPTCVYGQWFVNKPTLFFQNKKWLQYYCYYYTPLQCLSGKMSLYFIRCHGIKALYHFKYWDGSSPLFVYWNLGKSFKIGVNLYLLNSSLYMIVSNCIRLFADIGLQLSNLLSNHLLV